MEVPNMKLLKKVLTDTETKNVDGIVETNSWCNSRHVIIEAITSFVKVAR